MILKKILKKNMIQYGLNNKQNIKRSELKMNNIIKLVTKDSVNINNREFTRVMGGFN